MAGIISRLFGGDALNPNRPASWPTDRESFLVALVRRRARIDPALRSERVRDWPMFRFWSVPEAALVLLAIALAHESEPPEAHLDARRRCLAILGLPGSTDELGGDTVDFLFRVMRSAFTSLDRIEDRDLRIIVGLAVTWGERQPLAANGWPPASWLRERATKDEIEVNLGLVEGSPASLDLLRTRPGHNAVLMWLILRPDDEFRRFSSPQETWANLGGRAGIALVREGAILAHVVTEMS